MGRKNNTKVKSVQRRKSYGSARGYAHKSDTDFAPVSRREAYRVYVTTAKADTNE